MSRRCTAPPATPASPRSPSSTPSTPLDGTAVAALATELGADLVVVGPEAPLVAGVADAVRDGGHPVLRPRRRRPPSSRAPRPSPRTSWRARACPPPARYVCTTPEEVDDALDAFGAPVRRQGRRPRRRQGRRRHRATVEAAPAARGCLRPRRHRGVPRRPRGLAVRDHRRRHRRAAPARAGLQARARRRRGPQHRRHGRLLAAAVGRPEPGRRGPGQRPPADRRRAAPPRHAVLRPAVRRPRAHLARRAGHRVQRPVRRPRDPGRAGPAEDAAGRLLLHAARPARWPTCRRCAGATAPPSPWSSPRTTTPAPRAPATRSTGLAEVAAAGRADAYVLHAGTKHGRGLPVIRRRPGPLVIGTGPDLATARRRAYEAVGRIRLRGSHHRTDIAAGVQQ